MTDLSAGYCDVLSAERTLLTVTLPGVLAALPVDEPPWPLEGVEVNLARLAVLLGPAEAAAAAAALEPWSSRGARQIDDHVRAGDALDVETAGLAISSLTCRLVVDAVGLPVPALDGEAILRTAARHDLNADYRGRGAFTALGHGLPALAAELLGRTSLPPAQKEFFVEAALALTSGTSDRVAIAWRGLLDDLPERVSIDATAWSALFPAARVVHVLLGEQSSQSSLALLREAVLR